LTESVALPAKIRHDLQVHRIPHKLPRRLVRSSGLFRQSLELIAVEVISKSFACRYTNNARYITNRMADGRVLSAIGPVV
jgi:hypothetical protein